MDGRRMCFCLFFFVFQFFFFVMCVWKSLVFFCVSRAFVQCSFSIVLGV